MTRVVPDLAFETPRVRVRLLCEDDLDLYLALYTDPDVMRYIGPVLGKEEAEVQFRKALALNRDAAGRVVAMSLDLGRVRALRFERQ